MDRNRGKAALAAVVRTGKDRGSQGLRRCAASLLMLAIRTVRTIFLAAPGARRAVSGAVLLCAAVASTTASAASTVCNDFNTSFYDATYSAGSGLVGSTAESQNAGEVVNYTWTVNNGGRAYLTIASATLVYNKTESGSGSFTLPAGDMNIAYGNNGSSGSVVYTFTCVPVPTLTSLTPATGSTAGGTVVALKGSDFLSGATVIVGGVAATNVVRNSSTSLSFTTPPHAVGAVSVDVTNPGGTPGTKSSAFTYVVDVPRATTITSLSATMGPVAGGTSLTATGTGFVAGSTSITIGGITVPAANVIVASDTSLSFVTPAHAAGNVAVTVTVPDGTSDPVAGGFTYVALPTATNLTPASGTYLGGTTVFVLGSGFLASNTSVTIGGTVVPASSVTVSSATFLSFKTPAHGGGKVAVTVTTPGGTSGAVSGGFTYTGAPAPTVTALSPIVGGTAGGTAVPVTGTNFVTSDTSVTIGGTVVPASSVNVSSATSLTFNTPTHAAGNVAVTVTTPVGTTGAVPGGYTYAGTPEVTSISRSSGPLDGNVRVTITGSGFSAAAASGAVKFGVNDASYTIDSDTQITATAPAGSAGKVDIRVSTPIGTSATSSAAQFTYVPPPVAADLDGVVVPFNTLTHIDISAAITGVWGSIQLVDYPAHGSVTVTGKFAAYTPDAGFAGPDSFTYKALSGSAENGNSEVATVRLNVEQGVQKITFAPLSDVSLSASPLTLSATTDANLAVTFSSSTELICTVSGNALTLLQTGTCTIAADQGGNTSYGAASTVSHSFTVTPAHLEVTVGPASGANVGATCSQANTATGGIAPYSYDVGSGSLPPGLTLDAVTGTVSGTPGKAGQYSYAIRATDRQPTPVNASGGMVDVTIAKGEQTVEFSSNPPRSAAVGGVPYTVSANASSGLPVGFSLDPGSTGCALTGATATFNAIGTCRINADQ